ncbi:unnamed protein product, partial [marine sediment metagenome]
KIVMTDKDAVDAFMGVCEDALNPGPMELLQSLAEATDELTDLAISEVEAGNISPNHTAGMTNALDLKFRNSVEKGYSVAIVLGKPEEESTENLREVLREDFEEVLHHVFGQCLSGIASSWPDGDKSEFVATLAKDGKFRNSICSALCTLKICLEVLDEQKAKEKDNE